MRICKIRVKKLVVLFLITVVFVQCKSTESSLSLNDGEGVTFIPTLYIDSFIDEHQFEGKDSKELVRVELNDSIQNIPQWAFAIITTLEEVKLGSSVKSISDNAFFSCKNLSRINLKKVESIGENCFKFSALETANLSQTVTIGEFAFAECKKLKNVEFSDSLELVGDFAFIGDTALTACHVPAGIIGASAFMGCKNMICLSLGRVVSIGKAAFLDCVSLKSVTIPPTVREIEDEAFLGCENLSEVIVTSHSTKIAKNAFEKNIVLTYK